MKSAVMGALARLGRSKAMQTFNKVNPIYYAMRGIQKLRGKGMKKNHRGGTGPGGRGRPSAAQLRARAAFARRYGGSRSGGAMSGGRAKKRRRLY